MHVFTLTDKTGRIIRLTQKQWSHITALESPHAYMANWVEQIKETLVKPDKIISSIYDEHKTNYYKYYKQTATYLKVIVKYLNGDGFVITAYFVRNLRYHERKNEYQL